MNIEDRIERLERSSRRWRWLSAGLMLALGGAMTMGQQDAKTTVIEAQEFRVVDEEGRKLATLASDPAGGSNLAFFDLRGKPRAALGIHIGDKEGALDGVSSILSLSGGTDSPGIMIGVEGGYRSIWMHDLQGNRRLSLKVRDFGQPCAVITVLKFEDEAGSDLVMLGVPAASIARPADRTPHAMVQQEILERPSPQLAMATKDGRRILLKVWGDGQPSLDLWEVDGTVLFKAP